MTHELQARLRARSPDALVAYLTAGYPDLERFFEHLEAVCRVADAVEIGIPFTDPMADGPVLQACAHDALAAGFRLDRLLDALEGRTRAAPVLLMSYLNPLLAAGPDLPARLVTAGVGGLIVPDLPLEESAGLDEALAAEGLALVQIVAPTTPPERATQLAARSRGFVYVVTSRGPTGGDAAVDAALARRLRVLRAATDTPVLAGFGIRRPGQLAALRPHADGVIVGTALMAALRDGQDPAAFLTGLRSEVTA